MKTTNMLTMKTFYILAAFLGLQFNTIFAAVNFSESTVSSKEIVAGVTAAMLIPSTPVSATFEDIEEMYAASIYVSALMPVIPMIADFSDGAPSVESTSVRLAPATPAEADFEETPVNNNSSSTIELAPVTPPDADFEDHV